MEYSTFCRINAKDAEQLAFVESLIKPNENTPVFEEEVEPKFRPLFAALEDLPEAEFSSVDAKNLVIIMDIGVNDSDQLELGIKALSEANFTSFSVIVFNDEGGADGFVQAGEGLKRFTEWNGKPLNEMNDDDIDEALVGAIAKEHGDS